MSCCPSGDPNGLNEVFCGPYLNLEARRFLRRGLDARQSYMLAALEPAGRAVADLGAGVGALALSALRHGATHALLVDGSEAAVARSRQLADSLGLGERAEFVAGDAAALPPGAEADAVVLDRVVCCYPDAGRLLRRAAALSRRTLVFSYPPPRWWIRLGAASGNFLQRLFGRRFRFFVHDERGLLEAAGASGHALVERRRFGFWQVAVFERRGPPA